MARKERTIYDDNLVMDGRKLRGIVVNRIDPYLEGRIAVTIPRLIHKGDPAGVNYEKTVTPVETDLIQNDEITDLINKQVESSNAMWARPIKKPSGSYEIPYVGQTVYLEMEDGDPNKLYYIGIGPTISGDNPEMYNVQATSDVYTPDKKPNIHLLYEFLDRCAIYYNENTETRELRIHLPINSYIAINENSKNTSIEMKTPKGHTALLSDIQNDGIHLLTAGGSKIDMSGDGANIKMTNKAGATTDMKDATITHSAGGGKIVIGGGKVKIN